MTAAVDKRDPRTAPRCSTDPDRLSTSLTRSGKEDVGRAVVPPTTAGAGATVNPESPRSRLATTVLVTPSRPPTPLSRLRAVRRRRTVKRSAHAEHSDGQSIASSIVETASGHSESASALIDPGSSHKTATGSDKTAHGQKAITKSHGESAFVHATANGPWSKSATPKTRHNHPKNEGGYHDAPHENPDPEGGISVRSASGSSLR